MPGLGAVSELEGFGGSDIWNMGDLESQAL